jgi:thiol-activated cytolysin
VKGSVEFKKTLAKSKVTLFTIGGNAEVNAQAVDAKQIEDLNAVIKGKNALYSKNNPGQPIAYTVRFLKDGRLAKIGYTTDYTELICERHPHGWIGFRNSGGFVAKFYMNWKEGDQLKSWSSGTWHARENERIELKGNARDININGQFHTGVKWNNLFRAKLNGPPNTEYVAKGTVFNASVDPPVR